MKIFTLPRANKLYKRHCVLLITIVISLVGFSQNIGINPIGNQPNLSAGLDVDFANKGILIPRVALTGTANFAPLAANVAGMIVYNTATVADVTPGFYYNNGTKWITGFPIGIAIGNMLYWNGTAWMLIPSGLPGQILQISNTNIPAWGGAATTALTTTAVSAIVGNSATSGGNITSDGGSPVISRGVCWKTSTGPTIADSISLDGAGIGTYTSTLRNLLPSTTYYVKAYTINSTTNSYGNEVTFTTAGTTPILAATTPISAITGTSATSGGNVTSTGGSPVLERGICYATTPTPTTANFKVVDATPGVGSFTSNLTSLTGLTGYYVRSYAVNSSGTAYGTELYFTTLDVLLTMVTTAPSNIGGTTVTSGGTYNTGTTGIIWNCGVAYATVPNSPTPTYVHNGYQLSPYSINLTGLTANTTYYIRAAVQGSWNGVNSTIYGNELSFTTSAGFILPVIASTTTVNATSASTATSGGVITSDGGAAITAKGVCWSTSPNPVLGTNNFTSDGTGTATFASNITGLTANTLYYVSAYATNSVGTSYGPVTSFTTWVQAPYTVGQDLGYGYCAYVNSLGHGFIVSYDIVATVTWGCRNTLITTDNGPAIGTGLANTNAILAGCATRPIAASVAKTYTGGGFTDWYLPSFAEMSQIYKVRTLVGNLGALNTNYFTSSEFTSNAAITVYVVNFFNAPVTALFKDGTTTHLLAIRNF